MTSVERIGNILCALIRATGDDRSTAETPASGLMLVNAVRDLPKRHGLIFEEVDDCSDCGRDLNAD